VVNDQIGSPKNEVEQREERRACLKLQLTVQQQFEFVKRFVFELVEQLQQVVQQFQQQLEEQLFQLEQRQLVVQLELVEQLELVYRCRARSLGCRVSFRVLGTGS